jgi:hypothetical protein
LGEDAGTDGSGAEPAVSFLLDFENELAHGARVRRKCMAGQTEPRERRIGLDVGGRGFLGTNIPDSANLVVYACAGNPVLERESASTRPLETGVAYD